MPNTLSICGSAVVGTLFAVHFAVSEEVKPAMVPDGGLKCVVAFGDSITRGYAVPSGDGWVELLAASKGKGGGAVFNAGGNGNTSAEGLKRIDADVLSHMPGLVLVEFGGNDAVHDARAVSVDEFERNLLAINEKVKAKGGTIVFLTFPPIINEWHATRSDAYYKKWGGLDQCVEEYRQRTREVARRLGAPLFDLDRFLRKLIEKKGKDTFINKDGVHLTPEANTLIAEAVQRFLKEEVAMRNVKTEKSTLAGLKDLEKITFVSAVDNKEDFAFVRPPSQSPSVKKNDGVWVVILHGHGSKGDQLFTRPDIRDNWLPLLIAENLGIVTPNYRGNSWMCPEAAADLHALLRYLRNTYEAKKFIFISGSMGGTSNLIYATLHPEDVTACVSFCPATDLPSFLESCRKSQAATPVLKEIGDAIEASYKNDTAVIVRHSALGNVDKLTMPIRIVHGDKDPLIPIEQARRLREALEGKGAQFAYEEIPGGGHDAPLAKKYFAAALSWAIAQK